MPDSLEDLEAAGRDQLMGGVRVLDGDHSVLVAPHDERGHVRGEIEAVAGVHDLTTRLDHAPHGAHERGSVLRAGQRRIGPPELRQLGPMDVATAQLPADPGGLVDDQLRERDRHQVLGSRQRQQAEQPRDFAAESAAANEHEAVDEVRMLIGELQSNPAAERVTDDRHGRDVDHRQEVAQTTGERAERVVADWLRGFAMSEQIRGDHVMVLTEGGDHAVPGPRTTCEAMDQ